MSLKESVLWIVFLLCLGSTHVLGANIGDIENHWAKEMIEDAVVDGWVNGYEDETFHPENSVTRIEFLKMLLASSNEYLIVTGGRLYPESYLETAKVRGILLNENPQDILTRNDVCQILSRYIDLTNVKASKKDFKDLEDKDCAEILKLENLGVICGYEDGTFQRDKLVTRAEAVVLVQRAVKAKKERALNTNWVLSQSTRYTNYVGHEKTGSSFDLLSYEIEKGKLFITDEGRYQETNHEELKSDIFEVSKACKVIQNLVSDVGYVGVSYFPSQTSNRELIISYGQNEKRVSNQTNEFWITYFQDSFENLKENSRVDIFSENCYMKISVIYLWQDAHEFQKGNYVDSLLKRRLEKGLEGEFGEQYARQITEYIAQKIEEMFQREDHYDVEIGQKTVGKYQVDYYKKENGIPEFYISKAY